MKHKSRTKSKSFKSKRKAVISDPISCQHMLHIDRDLTWELDPSIPAETIFKLVRTIGQGGFGTVIELLHIPSRTLLAGKCINPDLCNSRTMELLTKEINLMKQIISDHTIHYYGSIFLRNRLTILMEFCPLGSIRDLIDYRDEVLTERQVALVLHDALNALKVLHEKHHVVHRDIKAANILLAANGTCRVTDFGVSRKFNDGTLTFSTQSFVGTPYWMAPEIINEEKYSYPADIWSLVATAVEMAEGAPPYCEYPNTRAMVLIATQGFPGLRFKERFSPLFIDFINECAVFDPNQRPTADMLLSHPFITQVKAFDRLRVMDSLLKTNVDFAKLIEAYKDGPKAEEIDDDFDRITKTNIAKAVKTLRRNQ